MADKTWGEMTPAERSEHMRRRKIEKREARERIAAEARGEAAPVVEAAPNPEPVDDTAPLSAEELARIREEAAKKVAAEMADVNAAKRKKLIAETLAEETLRQRRAAGLTDYRDDMLDILIDVAPFTAEIRIDGTVYQHGRWYKVDRRRYDSLREIMARSWDAEDRAGNPNRKFQRTVAGSMNPLLNELRLPDGTMTMGVDARVNAITGAISGGAL